MGACMRSHRLSSRWAARCWRRHRRHRCQRVAVTRCVFAHLLPALSRLSTRSEDPQIHYHLAIQFTVSLTVTSLGSLGNDLWIVHPSISHSLSLSRPAASSHSPAHRTIINMSRNAAIILVVMAFAATAAAATAAQPAHGRALLQGQSTLDGLLAKAQDAAKQAVVSVRRQQRRLWCRCVQTGPVAEGGPRLVLLRRLRRRGCSIFFEITRRCLAPQKCLTPPFPAHTHTPSLTHIAPSRTNTIDSSTASTRRCPTRPTAPARRRWPPASRSRRSASAPRRAPPATRRPRPPAATPRP